MILMAFKQTLSLLNLILNKQVPFILRTEKRGKMKEEGLVQRMKNKLLEEERLRNPFAQGPPWTTDVPEIGKKNTECEAKEIWQTSTSNFTYLETAKDHMYVLCPTDCDTIQDASGEGIPDLLLLLMQWAQKTMEERLTFIDEVQEM
uniref:Uncharacterized protein n=1 Tax=Leersia perrieri TaxID=77586 RepID=A0A0D9XXW1_9ORYZ